MDGKTQQADTAPNQFAHTRVGVAVIIQRKDGRIIVGQRKSSHGAGTIQLPGGHLEFGESFFACAERETLEETGLRVRGAKLAGVTNDLFRDQGRHYITVFVRCEMEEEDAEPVNMEPEKCAGWWWVAWREVRALNEASKGPGGGRAAKLFLPLKNLVEDNPDFETSD
ncbi:NUDIX domain-containing protein [Colletotrichum caudatum]|nr:NUDIX domain-containing protein [Colletotrichum caudatum]